MNINKSKLFVLFGILFTLLAVFSFVYFENTYSGCFLSKDEMQARWGEKAFEGTLGEDQFSSFSPVGRSEFTWWIVARGFEKYVKKSSEEVVKAFGNPDGKFPNVNMPSYLLEDKTSGLEWNLVFATGKDGKIKESFVWRKQCQ